DPLLGDAQLRRDRDEELLDVRAPGARRLGQPPGAGGQRLAGLPRGRRRQRAGVPFRRPALMAIDETRPFRPINIALLTVSDTRGPDEDTSGDILAERIQSAGHHLAARAIEKDDAEA